MMEYRKVMGLTYQEFLDTPIQVIYTDLEMMSIESEVNSEYQREQNKKLKPKK